MKHIPETSDALRSRNRSGGQEAGNPPAYSEDDHHSTTHGVQSKDSFESACSAGTPDIDVMHHSDLSNIKLKAVDVDGGKRVKSPRKNSSGRNESPAGRHHSSDRKNNASYQNANEQHHRHPDHKHNRGSPVVSPSGKQFKRKGGPLPPTPLDNAETLNDSAGGHREDVLLGPEHEYEDIPDQSDEDEDEESKDDRWNDTGDENTTGNVEDRDELDVDMRRRLMGRGSRRTPEEDATNNSNETRTLTQQCSLVAPNEVHITESPSLIAEPVLSESGA